MGESKNESSQKRPSQISAGGYGTGKVAAEQ